MRNKRVVVAMSGGVDSAVAAALLKEKGYHVIGMTMKMWPKTACGYDKKRACCSLEGIRDARAVAEKLDIPYYVIDLEKKFRKDVVNYFCQQYLNGRTPNPCIICNEKAKFGHLLNSANKVGANLIATGHHAKVEYNKVSRRYMLKKGRDKIKDQSYVLFSLAQKQLSHILLPVGYITKSKVRALAKRLGLKSVYKKPSSQEICFVPDSNYPKFLIKEMGVRPKPGEIVNTKGEALGRHKGIFFYTIGQRHGLGIAHTKPLYVIAIDKENNRIIVGEREDLKRGALIAEDVNWIYAEKLNKPERFKVKIRYMHKAVSARIKDLGNKAVLVEFNDPQEAITPGQAVVFYKGDVVAGGGWIKESIK